MKNWVFAMTMFGMLVASAGTNPLAAQPDPIQDVDVQIVLYRPGCPELYDYFFAVKNNSLAYDYKIRRTGTVGLACETSACNSQHGSPPANCCGVTTLPCSRTWSGSTETLLSGACQQSAPALPGFPNACYEGPGESCNCDNNTCGPEAWCASMTNAKVEVIGWRDAGLGSWQYWVEPVVICQGSGCPTKSRCKKRFSAVTGCQLL